MITWIPDSRESWLPADVFQRRFSQCPVKKKSHSLPVCTACYCLPLGLLRAGKYAIKPDCILPWISTSSYPLHQCSCISTWLVSLIRSRWKEMKSGNFNPRPSPQTARPFSFLQHFQIFVNAWGIMQVPLSKRFSWFVLSLDGRVKWSLNSVHLMANIPEQRQLSCTDCKQNLYDLNSLQSHL